MEIESRQDIVKHPQHFHTQSQLISLKTKYHQKLFYQVVGRSLIKDVNQNIRSQTGNHAPLSDLGPLGGGHTVRAGNFSALNLDDREQDAHIGPILARLTAKVHFLAGIRCCHLQNTIRGNDRCF